MSDELLFAFALVMDASVASGILSAFDRLQFAARVQQMENDSDAQDQLCVALLNEVLVLFLRLG